LASGDAPIVGETALGTLLRRLRRAASISQEELAERAGLSAKAVSALETGSRRHPHPRTLRALMDALGASDGERLAMLVAASSPVVAEAGGAGGTRPAQLPPDIGDFTGRADEVAAIGAHLTPPAAGLAARICAIAGQAGSGKSTLAVHVAHLLKRDFPDIQLYADLRGQDAVSRDPGAVMVGFLRALGVPNEGLPQQVDEQAALYRSLLDGRRALLLLDNAPDARAVRTLLPGCPTCAVLVTSRQRLATLEGAALVDLADMVTADAVALLGAIAGRDRVARDPAAAEGIVGFCGQLPLAVRIAGAVLRERPHWPPSKLASRLADERRRLDELSAGDLDVRASFELSYHRLAGGDARVFRLLAVLPGATFSRDVAASMVDADPDDVEDVLNHLCHAQLLQVAGPARYRLHDLIRLFARECLERSESPAEAAAAQERALDRHLVTSATAAALIGRPGSQGIPSSHLLDASPTGAVQAALTYFEAEWPNLVAGAARAAEARRWDLALGLAESLQPFFDLQSHWSEEERVQGIGLRAARELADRRALGRLLGWMGNTFGDQARWPEAISHLEESRDVCRLAGDRLGEAAALNRLGGMYRTLGELDLARRCQEQSIAIANKIGDLGAEGRALNSLGIVLSNAGRLADAIVCCERALPLLRESGDRHAEGNVLVNLGDDFCASERWEEAAMCYERQVGISRSLHDTDCVSIGLAGLARVSRHRGRLDEAMRLAEQAMSAVGASQDAWYRRWALEAMAATHRALGQWEEAVARYEECLAIHRSRGALQTQCWMLNHIGEVRRDQGRLEDSAAAFEQSLAIAVELRAPHEEYEVLRRLEDVYHVLGRTAEEAACTERREAIALTHGDLIART
jgi:tetratricopeptide (TPR) repeat protein/transcriptional regulator with XRE-family HTH domain